jgi:hypothetical protein
MRLRYRSLFQLFPIHALSVHLFAQEIETNQKVHYRVHKIITLRPTRAGSIQSTPSYHIPVTLVFTIQILREYLLAIMRATCLFNLVFLNSIILIILSTGKVDHVLN